MILLDTHAWVRWLHPEISRKLPNELREWLEASGEPFAISVISALEVAQLVEKGILELPVALPEWFDAALDLNIVDVACAARAKSQWIMVDQSCA